MKSEEFIKESLDDKSIQALMRAKEIIKRKREEELEAWKRDMEKNYPQLSQQPIAVTKPTPQATPQPIPQAQAKEPLRVIQNKLKAVNAAIEKYEILEKLKAKAEYKGLLTPALDSDTDVEMYVAGAYQDGYQSLNDKLDKSIKLIQQRLNVNKIAFREADDDIETKRINPGLRGLQDRDENFKD